MKVGGAPPEVGPLVGREATRIAPTPEAPHVATGGDTALVSAAARDRAAPNVDVAKVEKLKQELATEALAPNPTNIAAIMLAEPSAGGS